MRPLPNVTPCFTPLAVMTIFIPLAFHGVADKLDAWFTCCEKESVYPEQGSNPLLQMFPSEFNNFIIVRNIYGARVVAGYYNTIQIRFDRRFDTKESQTKIKTQGLLPPMGPRLNWKPLEVRIAASFANPYLDPGNTAIYAEQVITDPSITTEADYERRVTLAKNEIVERFHANERTCLNNICACQMANNLMEFYFETIRTLFVETCKDVDRVRWMMYSSSHNDNLQIKYVFRDIETERLLPSGPLNSPFRRTIPTGLRKEEPQYPIYTHDPDEGAFWLIPPDAHCVIFDACDVRNASDTDSPCPFQGPLPLGFEVGQRLGRGAPYSATPEDEAKYSYEDDSWGTSSVLTAATSDGFDANE